MPAINQHLGRLYEILYGGTDRLIARWIFLRALGLIYFSAFFALLFQVLGLIGSGGIFPAAEYLNALHSLGALRLWFCPSLLWLSSADTMILALCWTGLVASLLLIANVWPRGMLLVCFLCFSSFVAAAQDFSGYQSDGMLLEAGFLSFFLAPKGLFPGLGRSDPPVRGVVLLLLWEWFRIYFQSGVVKLESGDPTWRNLTAMYEYYQNGPLPTWIGWYLQHLPHWFHLATAALTLFMELFLVWIALLDRRWRLVCFVIVTVWQVGVIASANYAFLNYLVLVLAVLLLDDRQLCRIIPVRLRTRSTLQTVSTDNIQPTNRTTHYARSVVSSILLGWVFYATAVAQLQMFWRLQPFPRWPAAVLDPFRIANQYGLFAVMTPHRYEIEFQGSDDLEHWIAYPFRYKPQDLYARPRIYAPYQPRFDWNLWFASLGSYQENPFVVRTEELMLDGDRDVLGLFASDPFSGHAPRYIRAILWQYWFSTPEEKRSQGIWWKRQMIGPYTPILTKAAEGRFGIVEETAQ